MALPRIPRRARAFEQPPFVAGHQIELLTNGGAFFDKVVELIEQAQKYVFLESYIYAEDETGWRIAKALAGKASQGLEVCLLFDGFGSADLEDSYLLQFLKNAGVKYTSYRPLSISQKSWPWSRRNHRKSLIVDGLKGTVGGMNVADDYAAPEDGGDGWRDTSVCIHGPAIASLDQSFRIVWERSKGKEITSAAGLSPPLVAGVACRFTHNFLRSERAQVRRDYLRNIIQARQSILITNAYFVPDRTLVRALCDAAQRGVKVELILSGKSDVPVSQIASRSYYAKLLKAGVTIFEWHEEVLHAKTATIDAHWSTIGSTNLDYLSFFKNLEVNAIVDSQEFAGTMREQFDRDKARSRKVIWDEWQTRPLLLKLLESLFRVISRDY